jgi:hypothetical protein
VGTLSHQSIKEFGVLAVAFGASVSVLGVSSADNCPIVNTSKHLESRLNPSTIQFLKHFFCIPVVLNWQISIAVHCNQMVSM